MKKLLSVLLAIIMLFSVMMLAACQDSSDDEKNDDNDKSDGILDELAGKTPEQLYAEALAYVSSLKNFSAESEQDIVMTMEGQTVEMHQSVISMIDGENMYLKSDNDMSPEASMEIWYIDGVYYAITAAMNFKAEIAYEDYVEKYMPEGSTAEGALLAFPTSWFKGTEFVKVDSNTYYLELVISSSDYLEYFGNTTSTGFDMSAAKDITYRVYFDKEGNLGDIVVEFDFEIEGVSVESYSVTKITDVNGTTITAPENTDNWQDLTGSI